MTATALLLAATTLLCLTALAASARPDRGRGGAGGVNLLASRRPEQPLDNSAQGLFSTRFEAARFEVADDSFGEGEEIVHLKVLRNLVTGEHFEVAWNAGGRTESLLLRSPRTGRPREVLLDDHRDAAAVWRNRAWKGDILLPYANRIKNGTYTLHGKTYYLVPNEDRGVYGKNGLHGYLYNKTLRVTEERADGHAAEVTLSYDFDGTDPGYPFPLSVALTYRLASDGLTLTTKAWNRDTSGGLPIPFYWAWHSYFLVSSIARSVLEVDKCSEWNHILVSNNSNLYGDLIPTSHTEPFHGFDGREEVGGSDERPTYWDDEFKAIASAHECPRFETRVHDPAIGEASVLWADWQHPWLQVFTGTAQNIGEQAIAVEAMSGEADAWNNLEGINLLEAGEVWEGSMGVRLEASDVRSKARQESKGGADGHRRIP